MCFTASKLTLFFRSDKYSSANHAFSILEGLFFADAVVPKISVPDSEGILVPVVTEGFQVPVVVMLTADFQMHDLLCPKDGSSYTGYTVRKKNGQTFPYYKANTKGYPANVSASTVHQGYINLLNQYRVPDELHFIMEDVLTDKFYEKVELDRAEAEDIEKRLAAFDKKIKAVRLKYALDEIDEATCNDAVAAIQEKKAVLTREAAGLNEEISNLPEYISTTISMSSQLGTWWSEYDFDTCQSIQKLVHPRGIYWDNEKKCYLTIEENEVLGLFRSISSDYAAITNEKQDKSCDLSCLVAGGGLEPPTSGL